jgi:ribosomal protein S12 methylthiotransferase accessory factor
MLYSEQQFSKREEWNACGIRATWVPEPFPPRMEIEWSPVWSLTYNERRYVPTAYCYYGYSRKYRTWFARADSNGCAAGRTKEEAILQGFMELVERDCIALWWYNCLQKPAVDLSSFADPYFLELQTYYNSLHRDLWVLDLTNDLRIPTFAAVSRRTDKEAEDVILGFGSHFEARLAIQRSLTEMNQWLPIAHPLGKEDAYFYRDPESARWWRTISLATQPQLTPDTARRRRLRTDYAEDWNEDLTDDVRKCTRLAEACGLETLILDQTRPDTGLYVVKVVVPGLRHFWPRFGAGRLYNIPVRMEWIKDARTEEQLNRQYIFF